MGKVIKLWSHPIDAPGNRIAEGEAKRILEQYNLDRVVVLIEKDREKYDDGGKAQVAAAYIEGESKFRLQDLLCHGIRKVWELIIKEE